MLNANGVGGTMAVVYGADYSAREPAESHGGLYPADRGWVQQIQQATGRPQTGNVSAADWALLLS